MTDKYLMDGHKLWWHLDRVNDWHQGQRIAPLHIDVGLSKGCNIRCGYCFGAIQGNMFDKGSEVYFPREPLLRYVQDAGAAGVRSMAFIGEAEPLINPHTYEAIVCGKKAGVDMALGTNGILFAVDKRGEATLEHLRWLRFNISAASAEAYQRIHGSREFLSALEKIRFCVAEKERKSLEVTIGMQMVLTPETADQIMPLAQLGRELGVDYLVIKQCSDTIQSSLGVFNRFSKYDAFSDSLVAAEQMSSSNYRVIVKWKKLNNRGERNYDRCLGVPFLLYSSGEGKLYPCGAFFDGKHEEFCMGDLTRQSFKDILASQRYEDIVAMVAALDVRNVCYSNCRTDSINDFLWMLTHPPEHVNFI